LLAPIEELQRGIAEKQKGMHGTVLINVDYGGTK
jgi:hypothetical protein